MFGGTETLFVQTSNGTRHRQSRKRTYMCYTVVGLQVILTVIRKRVGISIWIELYLIVFWGQGSVCS